MDPSSPAPAHKTKASQIRRNVGRRRRAARFASADSSIRDPPRKHARSLGPSRGLRSDAPVLASAFSEHYFSTSLSRLNRVHYLRRHLTIFYPRTGTDEHGTAADFPPTLGRLKSAIVITLQSGHIYRFSADIYQNTACQSGGGDVAFLSLLGVAVISHLVNPHLKRRYPPCTGRFVKAARSMANLRTRIEPERRRSYWKNASFGRHASPPKKEAQVSTRLFRPPSHRLGVRCESAWRLLKTRPDGG